MRTGWRLAAGLDSLAPGCAADLMLRLEWRTAGVIARGFSAILVYMRGWLGSLGLVVFAAGTGITGIGCGNAARSSHKDAGESLDVAVSSGGTFGTGGVHASGGATATGGSGAAPAGTGGTASGGAGA